MLHSFSIKDALESILLGIMEFYQEQRMNDLVKYAIRHLAESSCSERELRAKIMENFSRDPKVLEDLDMSIEYLKENGFLNDWQFAKRLAMNYTHKGNRFICRMLLHRKISASIIAAVIASLPPESTRALQEALHKVKTIRSNEEPYSLLLRFLQGRLFSGKAIKEVVRQIMPQGLNFAH